MTNEASEISRTPLHGGVSCDVAIVKQADGREVVVKQALPRLRVVADWRSDPARASVEVAGLRIIRELLGNDVAPEVLWEDREHHRFAMERIDSSFLNWRDELNRRHVDLAVAQRAGQLLAWLHSRSSIRADIARDFANREYFEQLRIDPFFRRIAQRNPEIAPHVMQAIEKLMAPGRAFVHGDFSPKNMLVRASDVVILDCEVAHWGNPQFDVAFCLMHLLLDGLHKPPAAQYAAAAQSFIEAYEQHGGLVANDRELVRITGCLMLARLEGDSPIDFRDQLDVARVKAVALKLIATPVDTACEAVTRVLAE